MEIVDGVLHRLVQDQDERAAATLGRDVGRVLPRRPVDAWQVAAQAEALLDRAESGSFARGALVVLCALVAASRGELHEEQMRQRRSWAWFSTFDGQVLMQVGAGITLPTQVAATLRRDLTQVSRSFASLERQGLVCDARYQSVSFGDRRTRPRMLTSSGLLTLQEMVKPAGTDWVRGMTGTLPRRRLASDSLGLLRGFADVVSEAFGDRPNGRLSGGAELATADSTIRYDELQIYLRKETSSARSQSIYTSAAYIFYQASIKVDRVVISEDDRLLSTDEADTFN